MPEFSNRTGLARLNHILDAITEQHGFGSGGRGGLDTHQIERILDRVGHMRVPVVAADEVGTLRLDHRGDLAAVVNTDPHTEPGRHWVAFLIDSQRGKTVEYFDSLGQPPTRDFLKQVKAIVKHCPSLLRYKVNPRVHQEQTSDECGFFACQFLVNRVTLGQSFKQACSNGIRESERQIKKFEASAKQYL
jgi:hypothetical protein